MVIPLTFSISVFAYFWIKFSFRGHCFTMFPKKFCISVFLSPALTLFKSAHKFLVFVLPPFPKLTFVWSFVHFFTFKDRIPKSLRSHVVYSFTCQCCTALYGGQTTCHLHTHESRIIWESLPLLAKNVLILHRLAFCHILPKLATLHLLTISKFFLPAIQPLNF